MCLQTPSEVTKHQVTTTFGQTEEGYIRKFISSYGAICVCYTGYHTLFRVHEH